MAISTAVGKAVQEKGRLIPSKRLQMNAVGGM